MTKPVNSRPTFSRAHPGDKVLVIDWESSGSSYESLDETFRRFQGVSFGLIIADSQTFQPLKTLYREIKFEADKYEWSDKAEEIHGLTREYLEGNGVTAEEAAIDFATFILENFGTGKVVPCGHNVDFDVGATNQLLQRFNIHLNFHHMKIDTAPLGFVTLGLNRSDDLFGFFAGTDRKSHNALEDAGLCLLALRTVREVFNEFVEGME